MDFIRNFTLKIFANFSILKYPIPANSAAAAAINMLPQPFEWGNFGCDDQRSVQGIINDMSNDKNDIRN